MYIQFNPFPCSAGNTSFNVYKYSNILSTTAKKTRFVIELCTGSSRTNAFFHIQNTYKYILSSVTYLLILYECRFQFMQIDIIEHKAKNIIKLTVVDNLNPKIIYTNKYMLLEKIWYNARIKICTMCKKKKKIGITMIDTYNFWWNEENRICIDNGDEFFQMLKWRKFNIEKKGEKSLGFYSNEIYYNHTPKSLFTYTYILSIQFYLSHSII